MWFFISQCNKVVGSRLHHSNIQNNVFSNALACSNKHVNAPEGATRRDGGHETRHLAHRHSITKWNAKPTNDAAKRIECRPWQSAYQAMVSVLLSRRHGWRQEGRPAVCLPVVFQIHA